MIQSHSSRVKVCFKCNVAKALEEFYRHSSMKDGHLNKCKECTKRDVLVDRNENLKHRQEYDRARGLLPHRRKANAERAKRIRATGSESERERLNSINKRYLERNPDKRAAHIATGNAIRDGRLKKESCVICGNPQSQAHHEDYTKPLSVVWLCSHHHAEVHKSYRLLSRIKEAVHAIPVQ